MAFFFFLCFALLSLSFSSFSCLCILRLLSDNFILLCCTNISNENQHRWRWRRCTFPFNNIIYNSVQLLLQLQLSWVHLIFKFIRFHFENLCTNHSGQKKNYMFCFSLVFHFAFFIWIFLICFLLWWDYDKNTCDLLHFFFCFLYFCVLFLYFFFVVYIYIFFFAFCIFVYFVCF